jgi:hypothetical protein
MSGARLLDTSRYTGGESSPSSGGAVATIRGWSRRMSLAREGPEPLDEIARVWGQYSSSFPHHDSAVADDAGAGCDDQGADGAARRF